MIEKFHTASSQCSRAVTQCYSTSFFSAIGMLHKDLRAPICNIYGFVRVADEIVDTFHDYDKKTLLAEFRTETYAALERGLSCNPVLHSFQLTVNQYQINRQLIDAFFHSMEMDLTQKQFSQEKYQEYIYGSAEVVGLMCLHVFCEGNKKLYEQLKDSARSLGAAFQKVNFLRDIKSDYAGLSRMYFPHCDFSNFSCQDKQQIELDIQKDFDNAYNGIIHLPLKARFGVYVAYKYYLSLFRKIRKMKAASILTKRIRIPNYYKAFIVFRASVKNKLRLINPGTQELPGLQETV